MPLETTVDRVVCNSIRSLDTTLAHAEMRADFGGGILGDAPHHEHESANYIEAMTDVFRVLDQQLEMTG